VLAAVEAPEAAAAEIAETAHDSLLHPRGERQQERPELAAPGHSGSGSERGEEGD